MKLLKIKDNSQYKKDTFADIGNLTGRIADKTLEQLEREGVFVFPEFVVDAEDITKDQMILQGMNDTYRSGNVMGFLGCGDIGDVDRPDLIGEVNNLISEQIRDN